MKPAVEWSSGIDLRAQEVGGNATGLPGLGTRSPELQLMLACSRWPQSEGDAGFIRGLSTKTLDWDHFAILAHHHRVAPLVMRNLASAGVRAVPGQICSELEQSAESNAFRCMAWLSEVRRLTAALEEQHIEVRTLKGVPLAQLAFGDISLRACGDIDLLIDEKHIALADQILRSLGYDGAPYPGSPNQGFPTLDELSASRLSFYVSHWKDFTYFNHAVGFDLDLHWRCFRNSSQPGTRLCAVQDKEWVHFGSMQVATLPLYENILYLCVHGALDGWLYLKSLADVAALLRPLSHAQCDTLAARAMHYGVGGELAAAVVLVREYFAYEYLGYDFAPPAPVNSTANRAHTANRTLPGEPASRALPSEEDGSVAHILKYARSALSTRGALSTRDDIPSLKTALFELGLHSGLRYWIEILIRILFRPSMWTRFPLPDSLFALYALISPVDWLLHHRRKTSR